MEAKPKFLVTILVTKLDTQTHAPLLEGANISKFLLKHAYKRAMPTLMPSILLGLRVLTYMPQLVPRLRYIYVYREDLLELTIICP